MCLHLRLAEYGAFPSLVAVTRLRQIGDDGADRRELGNPPIEIRDLLKRQALHVLVRLALVTIERQTVCPEDL